MKSLLIVEDDFLIAEKLGIIAEDCGWEVTGIASNGKEALKMHASSRTQIVLMDIDLPGEMNGIEVAQLMNAFCTTVIIFVTSQKDRVTFEQAKATFPFQYLLKPVDADTLRFTLELALQSVQPPAEPKAAETSAKDTIFLKKGGKYLQIKLSDIHFLEAENKEIKLVMAAEKEMTFHGTLKHILDLLPSDAFMQVHRSYVINLHHLESVELDAGILVVSGKEVPLGRAYKDILMEHLKA